MRSVERQQEPSARGRRADALAYVKESLRERQCALVHKDDIFTPDEQRMWDSAQEFVERFANSEQAIAFDKTFRDHLQSNIDFDKATRIELDRLEKQAKEKLATLEGLKKELEDAQKTGKRAQIAAAKEAFSAASAQERAARGEINATTKRLGVERKAQNTVFKPYVFTEKHWRGTRLTYSDPSVLLGTADTLLDIADYYYDEPAKVCIPTLWRVSQVPEGVELPKRVGSQLWHRDQTDHHILKLFAYFNDVDEGSGALDYIPSSLPKNSKWAEKLPLAANTGYVAQDVVEAIVPKQDIFRCVGRAGTLAFADTAGLHRGGYAVSGPRITVQVTYLRAKPLLPQAPMIPSGVRPIELTERQYRAMS